MFSFLSKNSDIKEADDVLSELNKTTVIPFIERDEPITSLLSLLKRLNKLSKQIETCKSEISYHENDLKKLGSGNITEIQARTFDKDCVVILNEEHNSESILNKVRILLIEHLKSEIKYNQETSPQIRKLIVEDIKKIL